MDYVPVAEMLIRSQFIAALRSTADPGMKVANAYFNWPDLPHAPDVMVRAVRRKARTTLLEAALHRLSPEAAYGAVACTRFPTWWSVLSLGASHSAVSQAMQGDVLPRLRAMLGLRDDGVQVRRDGSVEVDEP